MKNPFDVVNGCPKTHLQRSGQATSIMPFAQGSYLRWSTWFFNFFFFFTTADATNFKYFTLTWWWSHSRRWT